MPKKKGTYYAVAVRRTPDVYRTWDEAKKQTDGYKGTIHKKITTEAEALEFVRLNRTDAEQVDQGTDGVEELGQQLESMVIKPEKNEGSAVEGWLEDLRHLHGEEDLIAFCAGSALRNGTEVCTAAYAVFFPLIEDCIRSSSVTDDPTNIHADCLAALEATSIANKLDPSMQRRLVLYSRYQGLVKAMANPPRWINNWQKNGWNTTKGRPVEHRPIYEKLLQAENLRNISWCFLDKENHPESLMKLHQQTHDEAERVARSATAA